VALRLFYGTLTVAPPGEALLEGASFVEAARTAPRYRLFSLDGFPVLVEDEHGGALDVQVWEVPDERWQEIVAAEPPDMVPGTVELGDGRRIATLLGTHTFVEREGGLDVTAHGSWRAYRALG
jgi:allophanate hydrolase